MSMSAMSCENHFMSYANHKGADQTAPLRSQICIFVVYLQDCMIALLASATVSRFQLIIYVAQQAGLNLYF